MQWLALNNVWFLAIIPAILILYLLKRKYEHVEISSILLWQQLLRDQEANRPWQKLQRNLLLFLQLLVACLLILAVLRPAIAVDGAIFEHTVLVVDSSGSMLTNEGEFTRFELAKQEIEEVITHLGSNQFLTLMEVGKEPKVLLSKSTDRQALREALKELQIRPGTGNNHAALSLALAIAQSEQETGIMWFGDGGDESIMSHPQIKSLDAALFEQIQVSKIKENVAIATFVTQNRGDHVEGLIRLDNHGLRKTEGSISLFDKEEQFLDRVDFEVQGGRNFSYTFSNLLQSEAYLAVLDIEDDGLEADNQLWSVPFSQREIRAVLVSESGNRFLSQALTLGDRIQLEKMNRLPDTLDDDVDVWIFDGLVPEELPAGNMFLVGSNQSSAWLTYQDQQDVLSLAEEKKEGHPLLEHVDWSQIHVAQVSRFGTMPEMESLVESLVESGQESWLQAGHIQGRKAVLLAFDLHNSDFPLRTAFPIFIQNALSWLSPIQSLPIGTGHPGERLILPLTPGAEQRELIQPDGGSVKIAADGTSFLFQVPEQIGLYQLEERRGDERIVRYFVVQMKENESNIVPQQLTWAQTDIAEEEAQSEETAMKETAKDKAGVKELSLWLAILAFLFVSVEWGLYQRGY